MAKLFRNMQPGEDVYVLDPKPIEMSMIRGIDFESNPNKYIKHQILACKIVGIKPHPKSVGEQVWAIRIYLPNRLNKLMTPEALDQAKRLGVTNTENTILVQKDASMVTLVNIGPLPTIMATTKEAIELWMAKTK